MPANRPTVTGLVLTYNGERLLDHCLESLAWCDALLVVDSNSTDGSRGIAEDRGARVLVRAWEGPAPQFRYAFEHIETEWVVSLDQDEKLTEQLAGAVQSAVASAPDDVAGFYCRRRSYYFDRYLSHSGWYPDRLLRVWRHGRMEVQTSGPHYSFHPHGRTERIEADILHVPYENLAEHVGKINYYTAVAADELREKGRKSGLFTALVHGLARFGKLYLLKRGFLDGRAGLILAIHGFFYAFHKYVRAAEPDQNNRPAGFPTSRL